MSPTKHKVIALISGGKDSLFSILHCLANGHEIVALANLYPMPNLNEATIDDTEGADIDSYMYQTVGHSLIPLYEEALGIPLYRQPIHGTALCASKDYAPTPSPGAPAAAAADETESLLPLLQTVLRAHPAATALSTGAILSTYQRTRIESVALRLGLVPLAFLWHYPALPPYAQTALLRDMAAVGMDARIIKVASGGLDEGFLGLNVADLKTVARLVGRMGRYGGAGGGAVLGEGGEFETLAVRGPGVLWRGRIELGETEVVAGEGGSAVLTIKGATVVENAEVVGEDGLDRLRMPPLFDDEFRTLWERLRDSNTGASTVEQKNQSPAARPALVFAPDSTWTTTKIPTALYISNMTAPTAGPTAAAQTSSITHRLAALLASHALAPSAIVSSTLLLRSMSSFTTINPLYGALFTAPNPPSRVTVACGDALPDGVEAVLSVVVALDGKGGEALHVQSRSYWAPANIGPYSQARTLDLARPSASDQRDGREAPREVWVAGQIPLVPASMDMAGAEDLRKAGLEEDEGDGMAAFRAQAVLALQHLWRVGRAVDVRWWTGGVAFLAACEEDQAAPRAMLALRAWKDIHNILDDAERGKSEDEEEVDVWDLKNGVTARSGVTDGFEGDGRPPLPDFSALNSSGQGERPTPPCLVVQVEELPRGAAIEWTSVGLTHCDIGLHRIRKEGQPSSYVTEEENTGFSYAWSGVTAVQHIRMLDVNPCAFENVVAGRGIGQTTVYTTQGLDAEWVHKTRAQVVPCRRVWDSDGIELAAAMIRRVWKGGVPGQEVVETYCGEVP